jgi:hypothetical protein
MYHGRIAEQGAGLSIDVMVAPHILHPVALEQSQLILRSLVRAGITLRVERSQGRRKAWVPARRPVGGLVEDGVIFARVNDAVQRS